MNNLFPHIEYLLLRHDCVIVPGLGAFISTVTPARIDIGNCQILPPSKSVMFNQAVTIDDGLLANSYARKCNVSFEEARQLILRDVISLKESLLTYGEVACGNIGKFILGEENNITFSPHVSTSLFSDTLGYVCAKMTDVAEPVATDNVSAYSIYETPDNDSEEQGYYHLRISKTFLRIASVVAVIFAIAMTVMLNPIPYDNREQRASVVPVEALMPPQVQENVKKDTIAEVPVIKKNDEQHIPAYYLIVATFSSAKEAEKYASAYSSEEFPLTTVSSRKMTRVAVASSDNRDSLRMKLNSTSISNRYPQAWIWSRN